MSGRVSHMSRNMLLVFAVIAWVGVAAVALAHLVVGDLLVPVAMGVAFVLWVAVRSWHYSRVDQRAAEA
jgi:hypothetical protein